MHFGSRRTLARRAFTELSPYALLVALTLSCSAKQAADDISEKQGTPDPVTTQPSAAESTVETQPTAAESTTVEQNGGGQPPLPPGGPLDECSSTTWTNPTEQKRESVCTQYVDESGAGQVLRYVCSCDVEACPIYVTGAQQPGEPPSVHLNDCVVDGVASGCDDSLMAACGSSRGQHGFCEREYDALAPTRPNQEPPASALLACFEQADGTHACQCPGKADLVATDEADCDRALLIACQAPCESDAGQCSPTESGFDCTCTAGFTRSVEEGLCDYALFESCEPECSNEEGACYWNPSGGTEIICRCTDDTEPQTLALDPNVTGDECLTPLVNTCGGSADGPNVWPH